MLSILLTHFKKMVEMSRKKRFVFNPDEETKEMLIATFAIRKEIFEKIFKIIKSSSRDTAPQHFLLVGQRGMGKTTLLLRLKYEMEDDKELNNYLLPVRFSEEQYQIGCLPDLWEETALYLEGLDKAFTGLKEQMLIHEKEKDYENICFELLTAKLKSTNKRVVLLIDNIGDLFHKFTDLENHRFRQILMTSPQFQLIGASSQMLEHTFRYDKPFFEFFYQLKLDPVKKEEANSLMKALATHYNAYGRIEKIIAEHPERVEVLRRITGGVPRTLVLLFEIFIDSDNGSTFEDLEEITDRVSPLYKERMDALKPQQQKIMDALARAWEPLTAGEILEQSKLYREQLGSNQISAQLKQLEENQLVEIIELGKRKKAYRIRERFFNIWYLMRHGRKNTKEQVLWLIRFLETWCTHDELKEMAARQIACLENDAYSAKAAFYKTIALNNVVGIEEETKKKLLESTEGFLHKNQKMEWAKIIHKLSDTTGHETFISKAVNAFKKGNYKEAEALLLTAVEKNEPEAVSYLGYFYYNIRKDFDKAEQFYLKAIEKGNVEALFNIALLYQDEKKDIDKAEQFYLKAIEKGNVEALFNIAFLYQNEKKDIDKAEQFYLKAIEKGNAGALNNIAILYKNEKKDIDKAEQFYLKAIEKGNAEALNNIAILYQNERKDIDKAEQFYLKAIEKGHAGALNDIAILYQNERKDIDKAEQFYLKAIEKGNVEALFNIALLYQDEKKDIDKAEYFYLKAIEKLYVKAQHNYIYLLLEKNDLNNVLTHATILFEEEDYFRLYTGNATQLVLELVSIEQYHFLLKAFQRESSPLMKYLKPVYYVLAWYMKEDLPGEYEKAGAELKETVDEMIAHVEKKKTEEKGSETEKYTLK
jgi:TPR repeat protein